MKNNVHKPANHVLRPNVLKSTVQSLLSEPQITGLPHCPDYKSIFLFFVCPDSMFKSNIFLLITISMYFFKYTICVYLMANGNVICLTAILICKWRHQIFCRCLLVCYYNWPWQWSSNNYDYIISISGHLFGHQNSDSTQNLMLSNLVSSPFQNRKQLCRLLFYMLRVQNGSALWTKPISIWNKKLYFDDLADICSIGYNNRWFVIRFSRTFTL